MRPIDYRKDRTRTEGPTEARARRLTIRDGGGILATAVLVGAALAHPDGRADESAIDVARAVHADRHPDRSPIAGPGHPPAAPSPLRSFFETRVSGLESALPGSVDPAFVTRLDVAPLLAPDGIERHHWRSFDHVEPVPATPDDDRERFVVVIDPGHGGSDPGAEGPNGLLEKHLTLDIARRVRLFLSELDDVEVVLTRERDRGLSRQSRVSRVRASEADLFVSLHFNHLPQSEITLVESFYAGPENIAESRALQRSDVGSGHLHRAAGKPLADLAFTRGSARFARLAQRRVFDEVGRGNRRALDAGVKSDTLFVLTRSFTSGALIELTCLSNAGEAERLTDEGYRDDLAAGLADAIREYRASLATRPLDGTGT